MPDETTKTEQSADVGGQNERLVMAEVVRPCERTIETKLGLVSPEDINALASNIAGFCRFIADLDSIDEIKAVAEAISDNWESYMDSC